MDELLGMDDLFEAAGRYGYLHPGYAEAHVELGEVRHLRRSGAWLLTRPIPGSARVDAQVGVPLLVCRDPDGLADDLTETAALADVVSITARSDPLAPVGETALREAFPDVVRVEAQHFVVDLPSYWPAREHRRAARRALQRLEIDIEEAPARRLDDWAALRPRPGGPDSPGGHAADAGDRALSRTALERLLAVPGCVGITALAEDGPVAMAVVYLAGEDAHLHQVAGSARGDELGALYALFAAVAEDMAGRGLHRLDLGVAGASDVAGAEDAARFMSGWTERTLPSWRCGRVIDRVAYDELSTQAGLTGSPTFPAYRDGGSA